MRLVNRLFGKLLYYIPNLNLIWKQIPEGNLRVGRERHKHVIRTDEYLSLSIHIAGEENGNPHQYSCLENPTDGGAWWATVHGMTKSWTSQMVNTEIRLIIFFAAKDEEALYSQQKQDQELTVAQIMNSSLQNSDLN